MNHSKQGNLFQIIGAGEKYEVDDLPPPQLTAMILGDYLPHYAIRISDLHSTSRV